MSSASGQTAGSREGGRAGRRAGGRAGGRARGQAGGRAGGETRQADHRVERVSRPEGQSLHAITANTRRSVACLRREHRAERFIAFHRVSRSRHRTPRTPPGTG